MKPAEIQDFIRAHDRVHARGLGSKPALHHVDAATLDLSGVTGIIEYQPDEFTLTVRAGTPRKRHQRCAGGQGAIPAI